MPYTTAELTDAAYRRRQYTGIFMFAGYFAAFILGCMGLGVFGC